jgi:hypothetical protein
MNLMKSTFPKLCAFKPMLVTMFVMGLFAVVTPSLQAQSAKVNDNFASIPNGPYVSPATAIIRLEEQCTSLKGQLEIYNSSSQEYKVALGKYEFFNSILRPLYDGKTTEESLITGLQGLTTDVYGTLSRAKRQEFKEEAIELLKV